jgi:hypothetical protein
MVQLERIQEIDRVVRIETGAKRSMIAATFRLVPQARHSSLSPSVRFRPLVLADGFRHSGGSRLWPWSRFVSRATEYCPCPAQTGPLQLCLRQ